MTQSELKGVGRKRSEAILTSWNGTSTSRASEDSVKMLEKAHQLSSVTVRRCPSEKIGNCHSSRTFLNRREAQSGIVVLLFPL